MKTIYALLVFILMIPLSMPAQSGRNKSTHNRKNKTIVLTEEFRNLQSSGIDSVLIQSYGISDTLYKRRPGRDKDDFIYRYPGQRFYRHPDIPEEPGVYPGAPKFYRKSKPVPSPYEKSFIIPHIASGNQKYYLIIKDPITHRIIN